MRLARIGVVCAILVSVALQNLSTFLQKRGGPSAAHAAEQEFGIRFGIIQPVGPQQFKLTQETMRLRARTMRCTSSLASPHRPSSFPAP